jgi:ribosomal protein L31
MDDLREFGSEYAQTYKAKCNKCGNEIEVSTQKDGSPEYYTDVFVRCSCGGSVHFELPVN